MTSVAAHEPIRTALRALVLVVAFVALLVAAAPAGAAESCGRKVIDDWYNDGRIDGTYALRCYDDAIEILPRDVRVYSSAEEDIRRASQAAKRGEPAPPARTDPSPDGGTNPPDDSDDPTTTTSTPPANGPDDPGPDTEVAPPIGTESASSVPIPLLILGGLALLLVAAGSAGYVIRRVQARRLPPPAA
ncbi:MAG: hypothetical protein ABIR67_12920 [Gaiellaceae bacterium]